MYYILLANSPKSSGGVEQVVNNLLEQLPKSVLNELTVVYSDPLEVAPLQQGEITFVNLKVGKHALLDRLFLYSQLQFSKASFNHLSSQLRSGDVVNIQGTEYAYYWSKWRRQIAVSFKLILSVHGSYFQQYTDFVVGRLPWKYAGIKIFFYFWRWYVWRLERKAVKGVDRFIFICQENKEFYQRYFGVDARNSRIIYNGSRHVERVAKKKHEALRAIIVGSTYYLKGLDIALAALKDINQHTPLSLNIVGFKDWSIHHPAEVAKWVKYIGPVDPATMDEQYAKADFLIMPSRFEGMPLTVLEALQNGLPVVASEVCKLREIDPKAAASITVKSYRVEDWRLAIEKMIDPKFLENFVEGAKKLDLSRFDWRETAQAYSEEFTA